MVDRIRFRFRWYVDLTFRKVCHDASWLWAILLFVCYLFIAEINVGAWFVIINNKLRRLTMKFGVQCGLIIIRNGSTIKLFLVLIRLKLFFGRKLFICGTNKKLINYFACKKIAKPWQTKSCKDRNLSWQFYALIFWLWYVNYCSNVRKELSKN